MTNNSDLNVIRGVPIYKLNESELVWDETACGSKLIIEDNGKVVRAPNNCNTHQSVRAKMALDNNGIFEWDIIIEKDCGYTWIGVCASKNFNYESWAGHQPTVTVSHVMIIVMIDITNVTDVADIMDVMDV